jgi:hypothetical protein
MIFRAQSSVIDCQLHRTIVPLRRQLFSLQKTIPVRRKDLRDQHCYKEDAPPELKKHLQLTYPVIARSSAQRYDEATRFML